MTLSERRKAMEKEEEEWLCRGELKKRFYEWWLYSLESEDFKRVIEEVRKDFLKGFTDDDVFVLKEYGLEDDVKLTADAIKLKHEILMRWGKQSATAFFRWFGEKEGSE